MYKVVTFFLFLIIPFIAKGACPFNDLSLVRLLIGSSVISNSKGAFIFNDNNSAGAENTFLISFKAQFENNLAKITWEIAQELNNEGFYVQTSLNGENFKDEQFIQNKGMITKAEAYEYIDYKFHSKCYYRLKKQDLEGAFEYSNIIYLDEKDFDGEFSIEVYPNPAFGSIQIRSIRGGLFSICLFDISGKILYRCFNSKLKIAVEEINKLLPELERGVYILSCNSGETSTIEKLIKN